MGLSLDMGRYEPTLQQSLSLIRMVLGTLRVGWDGRGCHLDTSFRRQTPTDTGGSHPRRR